MTTSDQIASASFDWAMAHIAKFGDTDIFPIPFEFEAIRHSWNALKTDPRLSNLSEYRTRPSRMMLVPKSRTAYRTALQLDPLDALVYAAVIFELAAKVEKYRVPASLDIACSYRLLVGGDGSLFERQNGWPTFHKRSVDLAKSGNFSHVLVADIADFYNQVSHHRVANALQSAGVSIQRAKNIEGFLSKLTAKQSRGLPVGPSGSIVLAEAALDDVDKFLMSRELSYVRYVDDFRIFCISARDAVKTAHDLADFLYTAHRLILTPSKTKLLSVDKFIESELLDPAEEEAKGKLSKLKSLIEQVLENTGYQIDFEELPESELNRVTRNNLKELFQEAVSDHRPAAVSIRYLLRRATFLRTTTLQTLVLDNLTKLAPMMREVVRYLLAITKKNQVERVQKALLEHLSDSSVGTLPFVRLWALELFIELPHPSLYLQARKLAEESHSELGLRPVALLAMANKQVQWVRAQKEKWANHAPWDRRAIIRAARILPDDERNAWCSLVRENASDPLDRAVAVLTGS